MDGRIYYLKSLARNSRVNTALQVIQHMNNGMNVVEACEAVGMPRSTYYYVIKNNPEAFAEYQEMIAANARERLGLILLSQTAILQKLIEDGLADTTKPRDRLTIYKTLHSFLEELTHTLQVDSQSVEDAPAFLKQGPQISHQVSRFTATETTITIKGET